MKSEPAYTNLRKLSHYWCTFDRIILLCFVTYRISERFVVVSQTQQKLIINWNTNIIVGTLNDHSVIFDTVILPRVQSMLTKTGYKQEPKFSLRSASLNKTS